MNQEGTLYGATSPSGDITGWLWKYPQNDLALALASTPEGGAALDIDKGYAVKLFLIPGRGSWYDGKSHLVTLNKDVALSQLQKDYIREMTHAQCNAQGETPDPLKDSVLSVYVEKMLNEEAEALGRAIRHHLRANRSDLPTHLEREYVLAYEQGVSVLQSRYPNAMPKQLHEAGLQQGKACLVAALRREEAITSTTGESHEGYYKKCWSAARVSWASSQATTLMQPVKVLSSVPTTLPITPVPQVRTPLPTALPVPPVPQVQTPLPTAPEASEQLIPGSRPIPTESAQTREKGGPTETGMRSSMPTGEIPAVWTGAKRVPKATDVKLAMPTGGRPVVWTGANEGPVNMQVKPAIPAGSTEVAGGLLRNTEHFALGALGAIFLGIVDENRKLTGYRYAGQGGFKSPPNAAIVGPRSPVNQFGVYEAKFALRGKKTTRRPRAFFPDEMSPQQVVGAINQAYWNRMASPQGIRSDPRGADLYRGRTTQAITAGHRYIPAGMPIYLLINKANKIIDAYPATI